VTVGEVGVKELEIVTVFYFIIQRGHVLPWVSHAN